ncbi:MAG: acetyltransferase [Prevotella bivia]|jgi:hypothetical protein|uniref:DUF7017 domain-containing protein n=1 Tax=Prevotella bivia TaxID=28125 RepID=UPI00050E5BA6|nr:hypothetical protein [Prevotella bivia]KGF38318.1 acetyltransferase [Prevotella bivia DNF00650]KXU57499.1 hypothetical protein HMPREF3218_0201475 [Prevotella bivia]MDK7762888.1 acetyltransferase [Prevotella bivia]MDU2328396.1 acetyltransferase [Prevotella bivia]MDU5344729.1 acetyltransferase [Prevotella bivia]
MEVRDVFELRKQGKTEEAYAAILPMYAVHKGKYTTLAMFWVGVDMMKLRFKQRNLEEAYKIFQSLVRVYPTMEDKELSGQAVLLRAAIFVYDHHPTFSMLNFIQEWGIEKLIEEDWKMERAENHPIPSLGMRIVSRVFKELELHPSVEKALQAANILAIALKYAPYNMNNQRYKAIIYSIMGKKDKAINIYRHLIKYHHQAYLYQELANLIDEEKIKIALLCRALLAQKDDKFKQRIRFTLANLFFRYDKSRAKYELDKCLDVRKKLGFAITWEMQNLAASLQDITPSTDIDQKSFYRQMENYVKMKVEI